MFRLKSQQFREKLSEQKHLAAESGGYNQMLCFEQDGQCRYAGYHKNQVRLIIHATKPYIVEVNNRSQIKVCLPESIQ